MSDQTPEVTDEALAQRQEEVAALRAAVAEARAQRGAVESGQTNNTTMAALDREAELLEAELKAEVTRAEGGEPQGPGGIEGNPAYDKNAQEDAPGDTPAPTGAPSSVAVPPTPPAPPPSAPAGQVDPDDDENEE